MLRSYLNVINVHHPLVWRGNFGVTRDIAGYCSSVVRVLWLTPPKRHYRLTVKEKNIHFQKNMPALFLLNRKRGLFRINILILTLCMQGNFSCFCCLLTFFSKLTFSKILSGTLSECQTVWTQIRTDILSVQCTDMGQNWLQRLSADDKSGH